MDHVFPSLAVLPPLQPAAPLDDKIARARLVLDALPAAPGLSSSPSPGLTPDQVVVAFTGGKDSTIALHLWSAALAAAGGGPLRAVSIDTGLKFPEVTAFRDELADNWGVELILVRPGVDVSAYPVGQDRLACCRDLKIAPLGAALRGMEARALITGIRRDENPARQSRPYVELRPETELTPAHWQVNPLLDWSEMDVWAFITGQGLPYCPLYHQGYRSLSCSPCTAQAGGAPGDGYERCGRDEEKERQMDALKSLGYF